MNSNGAAAQVTVIFQSHSFDLIDMTPSLDWSSDAKLLGNSLCEEASRASQLYGLTVEEVIEKVLRAGNQNAVLQ